MNEIKKYFISWDEFYQDSLLLSQKIKSRFDSVDGILVIARGGLALASVVSYRLAIRNIDVICLSSYDDNAYDSNQFLQLIKSPAYSVDKNIQDGNWIILDDLVDTGLTCNYMRREFPSAELFTLYTKDRININIDHYVKMFDQDTWLVFPWEI